VGLRVSALPAPVTGREFTARTFDTIALTDSVRGESLLPMSLLPAGSLCVYACAARHDKDWNLHTAVNEPLFLIRFFQGAPEGALKKGGKLHNINYVVKSGVDLGQIGP